MLKSIHVIAKEKMKEPIVLFDEPEIGLHASFLDELAETMLDDNSKLCIITSTHSPRLTKDLVTASEHVSLYNVRLIQKYSHIQRMKRFPQYSPVSKYRVTDDHINAYFSRAILFVEGETELELFSNPYLKALFPSLKHIDVFKAMSDRPTLNIMSPKLTNMNTPYLCLIDMDKAFEYNQNSKKLSLKNEYFKANPKERFQYWERRHEGAYLYHQRKRIDAMAKKLRIHYYLPFWSCADQAYQEFRSAVRNYLLAYNVFAFETTIEGALVSPQTMSFSFEFLRNKNSNPQSFAAFEAFWDNLPNTDQLNSLRIIFNGKSDLLKTWKNVQKNLSAQDSSTMERVMIGDKTSGWVSEFLDSFFKEKTSLGNNFSPKTFAKYIEENDKREAVVKTFRRDFRELSALIEKLCAMII